MAPKFKTTVALGLCFFLLAVSLLQPTSHATSFTAITPPGTY